MGYELRYDIPLLLRADIEFGLQSLAYDRFVLVDSRYLFFHTRFGGKGGNNLQRSSERHAQEIAYFAASGRATSKPWKEREP